MTAGPLLLRRRSERLASDWRWMRDDNLDIRRPELNGIRRQATVRWFKDEKGYGRITSDDGEVIFVHFAHIEMDGYRALEASQRISFVWRGGIQDHGRHRAESARVLPS